MKTIDELPIAIDGNWNKNLVYSSISLGVMKNKYIHVCTINGNLESFKLSNSDDYVIGFFAEVFDKNYKSLKVRFAVVSDVKLITKETNNEQTN